MPTTEIVTLDLVAGSDIGDPNNQASAILKESCDIITSQDGCQQLQFGTQVEHPGLLQMFINWDAKSSHDTFMAADHYAPFVKKFSTVFNGAPHVVHVDLSPSGGLASALSAPVTEIATFYHEGSPPADHESNAVKAIEALKADGAGILGYAYGTTYETIEREGTKGKGAVAFIGWETVDDHMKARTTQAFKDNIHLLRNGAKSIEMHHVAVMNFVS